MGSLPHILARARPCFPWIWKCGKRSIVRIDRLQQVPLFELRAGARWLSSRYLPECGASRG